jgi:hypothetical protein
MNQCKEHQVYYEKISNNIKIMENNLTDCSKTYDLHITYGNDYLTVYECEGLEEARNIGKSLSNTNIIFKKLN